MPNFVQQRSASPLRVIVLDRTRLGMTCSEKILCSFKLTGNGYVSSASVFGTGSRCRLNVAARQAAISPAGGLAFQSLQQTSRR
jgi:hypothetical protein